MVSDKIMVMLGVNIKSVEHSIKAFEKGNLTINGINLFKTLGYNTERQSPLEPPTYQEFEDIYLKNQQNELNFNKIKALVSDWKYIDLLFQITEDEIFSEMKTTNEINSGLYSSFIFFAIELKGLSYNKSQLLEISREINKLFPIHLFILFKYNKYISFSITDRRPNKIDETKDVLEDTTLIQDINILSPCHEHISKLIDLSLLKLSKRHFHKISNFEGFYDTLKQEFNDLEIEKDDKIEDTVKNYLNKIGSIPLLTREEERNAAKMVLQGKELDEYIKLLAEDLNRKPTIEEIASFMNYSCEQVKEIFEGSKILIRSNLKLVVSIAKNYIGRGLDFLDLIQEGNTGLIKAVEKFDPRKGNRFSTYATWWIRQTITRAIADQARTIRIPVHMFETLNRYKKISHNLSQQLGRKPDEAEISKEMGITIEKVREIKEIIQQPLPLIIDDNMEGSEGALLISKIEDKNSASIFDNIAIEFLKEDIIKVLGRLSEREQEIIKLRFGIDCEKDHTLEEIGQKFGLTRERIRQIEAKSFSKLIKDIDKELKEYIFESNNYGSN